MLKFTNIPSGYTYKKEDALFLDKNIWEKSRDKYLESGFNPNYTVPVLNRDGDFVYVGIEDEVCDLQMRILSEISGTEGALTFKDIYPEYKCVRIVGFNELAYRFALYLKSIDMLVILVGNEWSIFIEADENTESFPESSIYNIYANRVSDCDYLESMTTTVSVEFECIDKIYSENISKGYIKPLSEDEFLDEIKNKGPVAILGVENNTIEPAELFDYLSSKGIEVDCFVSLDGKSEGGRYLGKKVIDFFELTDTKSEFTVLDPFDVIDGINEVNILNRFGYRKNENYFAIKEIIELKKSLLKNAISGKNVVLIGDGDIGNMIKECLCLDKQNSPSGINVLDYNRLAAKEISYKPQEDELIFSVDIPYRGLSFDNKFDYGNNPVSQSLAKVGIKDFSRYFSFHSTIVDVATRISEKRSDITNAPKVKVASIEPHGGNVFFRGVLDGHPDILSLGYNNFNNELFYSCCKMAFGTGNPVNLIKNNYSTDGKDILGVPVNEIEKRFYDLLEKWGAKKPNPQDYFIILHKIFYPDLSNDYSEKIIYWEPHMWPRAFMTNLTGWLNAGGYDAENIILIRNLVKRSGSVFRFRKNTDINITDAVFYEYLHSKCVEPERIFKEDDNTYIIRFEDLKLNPEDELKKLCEYWDISWDDILCKVTQNGEVFGFDTGAGLTFGFDLKPVFNSSEDMLSESNRMIIGLANYKYQNEYGYECENPNDYSMRELMELCSKEFPYYKKIPIDIRKEDYIRIKKNRLRNVLFRLWYYKFYNK